MLKDALKAGPIWSLGAMSGTSLDGVDAAMILTDGARIFQFGTDEYRPYTADERAVLKAAMGRWEGLDDASAIVEHAHCEVLSQITGAQLIGFHGQTTAHDPGGHGTCQIGDGRVLAHVLDCPVAWDFRSADVQMGGQGAPLAPFYHHACAQWMNADAPVAFVNLGGVGNLTWVDPGKDAPADPGACLAFDVGPANAPLNDLMRARLGRDIDADGALAAQGTPDGGILDRLAAHEWFQRLPPKSLDRDDFAWLNDAVADLSDADAAATLTAAVATSVALGLHYCPAPPARLLVTGGGRLNPTLMGMLTQMCDCAVAPVEDAGLDGDMLEAQAFAFLAVRVARGWPISAPGTTGVDAPLGGGILSMPGDLAGVLSAAR